MKFSIRDLLLVTVILALTLGSTGCVVEHGEGGPRGSVKKGDIQYYAPGPEFKRSQNEAADSPNSSATVPNQPKP